MKKMHPSLLPFFGILAYVRQLRAAIYPTPHPPFFSFLGNFSGDKNIFFTFNSAGGEIFYFIGNREGGLIFSFAGNFSFIGNFPETSIFSFIGIFSERSIFSFIGTFSFTGKSYELSDHLGNVSVVVSDRKVAEPTQPNGTVFDHWKAEVLSATDYYPFGMAMPGRSFVGAGSYRWGFNGKEKDDELKGEGNSYDYGARIYDPRVGRWWRTDGRADLYPGLSPYGFTGGNPISNYEKDGNIFGTIIGTVVGGALGAYDAYSSGKDVYAGFTEGAVSGAITGAVIDLAVGATIATGGGAAIVIVAGAAGGGAGGALGGAAGDIAGQLITNINNGEGIGTAIEKINFNQTAEKATNTSISGSIGGAGGGYYYKGATSCSEINTGCSEGTQ